MADDRLFDNIPDEVREQHPEAVACALACGEEPLPDGTWQTPDGRVVDPQFGDGRLIPLNAAILYGMPIVTAILIPITWWTVGFGWQEFAAFAGLWVLTGISITAGYHRLFSHRTYKAPWPVRLFFAIFGGMAMQNSILVWSRDHRYHHGMVDTIGDPYNARRGFWHSHFTWVLRAGPHTDDMSNVGDLEQDPIVMWQHRHYSWLVWIANVAIVLGLGALTGRWLQMFVIAGLARLLFVQHGTFLINSWAHLIGSRPWSKANTARDSWLLSLFTFGEGYHNYHHAFANDYRNGVRWYHFDPSKWLIWGLSRVGLAWDLRRVHIEVTLHQKLEEHRRSFSERLVAAGEGRLEEWAEGLRAQRDAWMHAVEIQRAALEERRAALVQQVEEAFQGRRDALGLQLLATEHALEEALRDLRKRRRQFSKAVSGAQGAARTEVEELRRSLRERQREVTERWEEFQRAVQAYETALTPVPVRRQR